MAESPSVTLETRYAASGDVNIAYQTVGSGPVDLVYVPGWTSNVELMWEEPGYARYLERLASFSRLILFDKRGTGMSDRVPRADLPTLETRMDDVRAVMDAVGSRRAVIFGVSEGGNMSMLFAATYPERTIALATFGVFARRMWAPDYPWAPTVEERERWYAFLEREWGKAADIETLAPTAANDAAFVRWYGRFLRQSASPKAALALARMNTAIDVRGVLPTIRVPTLVMHRVDDRDIKVEEGRFVASLIPGSKYVELAGQDHLPWVGDQDQIIDEVEEFVTGERPGYRVDRVLSTVLFTDIVDSTRHAAALGDRAWHELRDRHDAIVRHELERHRGHEVKTMGDGFLATFDGPARGIKCAREVARGVRALDLEVRAGLHTGECELTGDDVVGIAVHVGARVAAMAGPGEVLVSGTVKDLVAGSGISFVERGDHELKGVPGTWRIFAVAPD
jgi:pimeloyl-ACP methyl ester carboxylesterase